MQESPPGTQPKKSGAQFWRQSLPKSRSLLVRRRLHRDQKGPRESLLRVLPGAQRLAVLTKLLSLPSDLEENMQIFHWQGGSRQTTPIFPKSRGSFGYILSG